MRVIAIVTYQHNFEIEVPDPPEGTLSTQYEGLTASQDKAHQEFESACCEAADNAIAATAISKEDWASTEFQTEDGELLFDVG